MLTVTAIISTLAEPFRNYTGRRNSWFIVSHFRVFFGSNNNSVEMVTQLLNLGLPVNRWLAIKFE